MTEFAMNDRSCYDFGMKQKRSRGFLGWLFYGAFLFFNVAMLLLLIRVVMISTETAAASGGSGLVVGVGLIGTLLVWALGSVILGILARVTSRP